MGFRARAIPCWLARSCHRPKSCDVFRRKAQSCKTPTDENFTSLWPLPAPPASNPFNPSNPSEPVLNCKGHFMSFTSVCEPVCRVSDEGGFGRAWPLGHAQPVSRVSGKTDRSRGWRETRKTPNTIVNKGRIQISTPPVVWRGMWRG